MENKLAWSILIFALVFQFRIVYDAYDVRGSLPENFILPAGRLSFGH
ncbi:MAG: hypothetical protein GY754_26420 [bacterium]|nr:hypothetical protein [bacterium]